MTEKIIVAGAGGQGIMLLGKIITAAADKEKKFVTWLPSYGPEVRGGTSHCMIVISDEPIGSPFVGKADTLIVMNAPSMLKFKDRIKPRGLLIVNTSLVGEKVRHAYSVGRPFTDMATQIGNIKVANMIVLGCYIVNKKILGKKTAMEVIAEIAPPDKKGLIAINQLALSKGMELGEVK